MLKFSFDPSLGVPDGYVYTFPDGYKSRNLHRTSWYDDILKHYRDNGIPIPEDWKEQAEHQWCLGAPPGFCVHETGEGWVGFNSRLTAHDFLHGTVVLSQIAMHPDPLVDKDLAESRARKCIACPANINVSGCVPCLGIANFILNIKGKNKTPHDHLLKTCGACKCSTEAKVWVKAEVLNQHEDATALAIMSSMPDCWVYQEISQLRDNQPS